MIRDCAPSNWACRYIHLSALDSTAEGYWDSSPHSLLQETAGGGLPGRSGVVVGAVDRHHHHHRRTLWVVACLRLCRTEGARWVCYTRGAHCRRIAAGVHPYQPRVVGARLFWARELSARPSSAHVPLCVRNREQTRGMGVDGGGIPGLVGIEVGLVVVAVSGLPAAAPQRTRIAGFQGGHLPGAPIEGQKQPSLTTRLAGRHTPWPFWSSSGTFRQGWPGSRCIGSAFA